MVRLVSTRDIDAKLVGYDDAIIEGLASDGGLLTPLEYPQISKEELSKLRGEKYADIVYEVKKRFLNDTIPDYVLRELISKAYESGNFREINGSIVPLREIAKDVYIENLSLGPTAAFKDMALQLVPSLMNYYLNSRNSFLNVLGATSGDTGSSAEKGAKGLTRLATFMISPLDGMSLFQKAQMQELEGGNTFNISIRCPFDDGQDLVKKVSEDLAFKNTYHIGALNSINLGRITAQIPYTIAGYLQATTSENQEIDVVVPSGNFGDALSVYIAKQMGIPIRNIIVATNENTVLDGIIRNGVYTIPKEVIVTSSPSMDIRKSSNFERLLFDMMNKDPKEIRRFMKALEDTKSVDLREYGITPQSFEKLGVYSGTSTSSDRLRTIRWDYEKNGEIMDTHTADGVKVGLEYKRDDGVPMICFQTALAVKFEDTIKEAIGFVPEREERFRRLEERVKHVRFPVIEKGDVNALKSYIAQNAILN